MFLSIESVSIDRNIIHTVPSSVKGNLAPGGTERFFFRSAPLYCIVFFPAPVRLERGKPSGNGRQGGKAVRVKEQLERIRERERAAREQVREARLEADRIIEQARVDGERLIEETKAEGAGLRRERAAAIRVEAETLIAGMKDEAADAAEALAARAGRVRGQAIELIVRSFRKGV